METRETATINTEWATTGPVKWDIKLFTLPSFSLTGRARDPEEIGKIFFMMKPEPLALDKGEGKNFKLDVGKTPASMNFCELKKEKQQQNHLRQD